MKLFEEKQNTEMEIEENEVEKDNIEVKKEDNVEESNDGQSYGVGIGNALKLCRQQKYIEDREEMIGRNKDARIHYEPGTNFVIEHRDKYGNLLSTKEAFRELSYTFHGYKPKKNKSGKKILQIKETIAKKGGNL